MTIEHSLLTGASLHEPKGVAAAAANKVYVSNGVGSGTWTTITNPFGSGLLHVRDEVSSGTAPATITPANTWNTRRLQTVKTNEVVGSALSSNQLTGLTSGTYYLDGWSDGYFTSTGTGVLKLRIRNITAGTTLIVGDQAAAATVAASAQTVTSHISGRFTLAATSTIELQAYTSQACVGGNPLSSGEVEVYTDLKIWKIS